MWEHARVSPPAPAPAARSPEPPARMPRAGPLCRGFGFQGGARIPAAPGNSRSQRGQSPPSPDPSLWPFAHGQSQPVSTGGGKGSCGTAGMWGSKAPPPLTATAFTAAGPKFAELEIRSGPSLQRTQGITESVPNGITLIKGLQILGLPPASATPPCRCHRKNIFSFQPRCGFPQIRWQAQLDSCCLSFSMCRTLSSSATRMHRKPRH